jgi:hypothetical protein
MIESLFHEIFNYLFWAYRLIHTAYYGQEVVHQITMKKLPWLWIGAICSHEKLSMGHIVDQHIHPGMRVTTGELNKIADYAHIHPEKWIYLDAETLEEKEFPSEGFVIEDELPSDRLSIKIHST